MFGILKRKTRKEIVMQDENKSIKWYRRLSIHQKIYLKSIALIICGITWEDLGMFFNLFDRIGIMYNKLVTEEIIC